MSATEYKHVAAAKRLTLERKSLHKSARTNLRRAAEALESALRYDDDGEGSSPTDDL